MEPVNLNVGHLSPGLLVHRSLPLLFLVVGPQKRIMQFTTVVPQFSSSSIKQDQVNGDLHTTLVSHIKRKSLGLEGELTFGRVIFVYLPECFGVTFKVKLHFQVFPILFVCFSRERNNVKQMDFPNLLPS